MATHKPEEPKKVKPVRVTIFTPSPYGNFSENVEYYTEGQGSCKKIRNETFSQPRLVIEFDDDTEIAYIGIPFIINQSVKLEIPKPTPKQL